MPQQGSHGRCSPDHLRDHRLAPAVLVFILRLLRCRHQWAYRRTILTRLVDLRRDPKKLNKTNNRAEDNAKNEAPGRAAKEQVRSPSHEKHKGHRAKKDHTRRPCKTAAANILAFE